MRAESEFPLTSAGALATLYSPIGETDEAAVTAVTFDVDGGQQLAAN